MPTTSGTTSFGLDIHEIIDQAYDKLGGEFVTGIDAKKARTSLNLLFTDMINRSAPLAQVDLETISLVQGQRVYNLDSSIVDVVQASSRVDGIDSPMERLTRVEYLNLPVKDQTGPRPTQYTIERERDSADLVVWPVPSNSDNSVVFYAIKYIEDVDQAYEAPDISRRYLPAIIFGLAYFMSFNISGFPPDKQARLERQYEVLLQRAMNEESDRAGITIAPYING